MSLTNYHHGSPILSYVDGVSLCRTPILYHVVVVRSISFKEIHICVFHITYFETYTRVVGIHFAAEIDLVVA